MCFYYFYAWHILSFLINKIFQINKNNSGYAAFYFSAYTTFENNSGKTGLSEALIEKDFWVCYVLKKIFEEEIFKNVLLFKGGTSLSKCFQLIERFSEDVDLILDWQELGISDEEAWQKRSGTKQDKFNHEMDEKGKQYISDKIVPRLKKALPNINISLNSNDGNVVILNYPAMYKSEYLLNYVKLEIGPRASRIPTTNATVCSYAAEKYPQLFEQANIPVVTIKPHRTFWEKATILHQIASVDESKQVPPRYSRHYYDLFKMSNSKVKKEALKNLDLLLSVAQFKAKFYRSPSAKYELAKPGSLKLLPSENKLLSIRNDYQKMQEMFFNAPPSFETIITMLRKLEEEINI